MKIETINKIGLIAIFFLMRIPNILLFPIDVSFFYSNNVVRALCLVMVALNLLNLKNSLNSNKIMNGLFLLYFFTQSLSIVAAQNLESFFLMYKDVLFGVLFYFTAVQLVRNNKNTNHLMYMIVAVTGINIGIQLLLYFNSPIGDLFKTMVNSKYLDFFNYQFQRGRYFGDSLDEAFIPVLIYILFLSDKKHQLFKLFSVLILCGITYITFISSWRTKLIIYIMATVSACLVHIKYSYKFKYLLHIFAFVGVGIVTLYTLAKLGGVNQTIITRIFEEDVLTSNITTTRLTLLKSANDIGLSSPFFGVGLGNYYDYLSVDTKKNNKSPGLDLHKQFILMDDPHNVFMSTFALTGGIGLIGLLLLLGYCVKKDLSYFIHSKKVTLESMLILTFWSLFIYSLFNPWIYFSYISNLWFMRGLVDGLIHEKV